MPRRKPPKTRKAVSKRFKITGTGKVLRHHGGKRHLMKSKSGNRRRYLGKAVVVHETDAYRVTGSLPFDHRG
jgi:large subunit ribosomal protein L35